MSHSHKRPQPKPDRKPRYLYLGVGLAMTVVVGVYIYLQSQRNSFEPLVTGAPRVQVTNPVVDHGELRVNEMVTTAFEIQNVGDENLYFTGEPYVEVIEGCCPPDVLVTQQVLAPGEKAEVKMTYTMHEGMDGPHEFRIHVNTNDPTEPETLLTAYSNWVR
jgi:hypothetical protein